MVGLVVVEVGVGVVIWFHQVLYNGEGLYSKHHLPKAARGGNGSV